MAANNEGKNILPAWEKKDKKEEPGLKKHDSFFKILNRKQ